MHGAALVHALTEPTRNAILDTLRGAEASVSELVERTQGEQSNISHHLRALREAGIVAARKDGRRRLYHLAAPEVAELLDQLDEVGQSMQRVTFYTRLQMPVGATFHGYG